MNEAVLQASADLEPDHPAAAPVAVAASWYDPASTRHDFGLVLAGTDVTRSHTYRVLNRSDRPISIRGVNNRKPCCGDVGPVPAATIEPGRALEVPIVLKLGLGSGAVVHVAAIEVEGADEEVTLATTATAQARATIEEVQATTGPLEPNQPRRVEYLIRSFGVRDDPPVPLVERSIRCELPTEWVGAAVVEADSGSGVESIRRTLAVTLPAGREPGQRAATLEVCDGAGATIGRRYVTWETAAALTATPSGLILGPAARADSEMKLIIRARDNRPFRVIEVTSTVAGLNVEVDHDSRPLHAARARYAASANPTSRVGEVVLRTDHPDQPTLKVAVYLAGPPTTPAESASSRSAP